MKKSRLHLSLFTGLAMLLNSISYAWVPKRAGAQVPQKTSQAKAPTRRALLVPIGNYPRPGSVTAAKQGGAVKNASQGANRTPGRRDSTAEDSAETFAPLSGPPKDAGELKKLLVSRYGFKETYVYMLPESEATHDGILQAIQRYLIDAAEPGDECLFYYSGHGSFVVNSKSENKQDETIVPVDYVRPVTRKEDIRDIRDKELVQYFNRAIEKGIVLTAIFDSCHSGSIARGDVVVRAGAGITFDIAEAPTNERKPAERGALILSAALAHQSALENEHDDGVVHGDFTWALLNVLSQSDVEQVSAERVFQRIAARMKGKAFAAEPNLDANGDRRRRNLFGSPVGGRAGQTWFVVRKVEGKEVTLDKGKAYGLTEGSELVSKTGAPPIRLQVKEKPGMASSVAEPINPADLKRIKDGDEFRQDTWVASNEDIHIWMPASNLTQAGLRKLAKEAAALKASQAFHVISDPTAESFTHRLYHDGTIWKMDLPTGRTIEIGGDVNAQVLKEKARLDPASRVFISLPLFKELKSEIGLGPGTNKNAVNVAAKEGAATYKLVGRSEDGETIEYAWVLNSAIRAETESEVLAGRRDAPVAVKPSPLPPITDWVSAGDAAAKFRAAADRLEDLALRLNKISGWITLRSPQETDAEGNRFPYKLVIQKDDGTSLGGNERMVEENIYRLALVGEKADLDDQNLQRRWVYIFSIDGKGDSSLLYPGDQGIETRFPKDDRALSVPLTRFRIKGTQRGGVLGPETYVLLTTSERLASPGALEFQGVRSERGGAKTPLERLLNNLDAQSRSSGKETTPANWTVQQVFLESVPKPKS